MKRIEKISKLWLYIILGTIIGIICWGVTSSWGDLTKGDFTETPSVTWTDIEDESKKSNILVVVYKKGSEVTPVLKPAIEKAKQQVNVNGEDKPRVVYVDADSVAGRKIVPMLEITPNGIPALVPVKYGNVHITVKETNKPAINGAVLAPDLVAKNSDANSQNKYTANEDVINRFFTGTWIEN